MQALFTCIAQQHDLPLVGLAFAICCLGAAASFALGREAARSADRRFAWAVAGVVAATATIWATHFIAMLAFEPGLPFGFDLKRTVLSFVVALLMVGAGAEIVANARRSVWRLAGAAVIGLAIAAMHYTGMDAFEVQGRLRWDAATLLASVSSGVVLAALAGRAAFAKSPRLAWCAPALFVLAVCSTHFVGMSAATIVADPSLPVPGAGVGKVALVMLVANVVLVILALSLLAVWLSVRERRQLAAEDRRLRNLIDNATVAVAICQGGTIVGVNPSFARLADASSETLVGRRIGDVLPDLVADDIAIARETDTCLITGRMESIPVRILGQPVEIGRSPHVLITVDDQRDRLRNDARIMQLAHGDALTGLANRLSFTETLAERFRLPGIGAGTALLMLDLDRFKAVNDTLGHGMGDALLRRVAGRLKRAVREDDLVARLGGDEFAILLADRGDDLGSVRAVAENVVDLVGRPFLVDGHLLEISASVGIALAPADGGEPDALTRSADLALYRAKHENGGTYRFFEAEMNARAQARRSLEMDLRRAAGRQEFEVHYQPQVDPKTGTFEGAEALVRWNHPERGMVSPADFIPLAEELGLIGGIGEWVLRTACTDALRWPGDLSVAVNLSPVQFRDARLASTVEAVLAETGLPGSRLELEVTENALLQDDGNTLAILQGLRALGIRISMDDFGTGYSSLSYLRRFPFDKIKIDQSFIRQIPADPDSVAIVQAIAGLGAKLNMTVNVEGVETAEQLAFAVSEGCDQIQGYLISRPVPAPKVLELFAAAAADRRSVA